MNKTEYKKHKAAKKADFQKRHKINSKKNRKRQGGKMTQQAKRRKMIRKANKVKG